MSRAESHPLTCTGSSRVWHRATVLAVGHHVVGWREPDDRGAVHGGRARRAAASRTRPNTTAADDLPLACKAQLRPGVAGSLPLYRLLPARVEHTEDVQCSCVGGGPLRSCLRGRGS